MKKIAVNNNAPLIILNPVSGPGNEKDREKAITKVAKDLGWNGHLVTTTLNRTAADIAKHAIKNGTNHLVVCGGDGTIGEVVGVCVDKKIIIGIVPLGTGNLFAQNLGIPLAITASMKIALYGKRNKIDIGRANKIYFTVLAGIGFDAEMMKGAQRELKNKIGVFAYILTAVQSILRSSLIYQVQIDNRQPITVRAKTILVANLGKIQGGIMAVPQTSANNGRLSIGIIQAKNWYYWISLLVHALSGNINKSSSYKLLKGSNIVITLTGKKRAFECDGNIFPPTKKLTIEILPRALSILTP
ncbi:MAG: diacylglycerol/lipid kinase family protein [Candidatus Levyibacteriota bacterium]